MKQVGVWVALGATAVCLTGCGGEGFPWKPAIPEWGRASFLIQWPERGRLIPRAANSVKVAIQQGEQVVASQVVDRPAQGQESRVDFPELPVGDLLAVATAYPEAGAQGVPQAQGSAPLKIQQGQNTTITINMVSTITRIEVTPTNPSVAIGQSIQLAATAQNAAGDVVLISESKLRWDSSDNTVATVDANGKMTGVAAGTAHITVTETESGKSAEVTVTVTNGGGGTLLYDASLGTLPSEQGWTRGYTFDPPTPTVADGILRQDAIGYHTQYWKRECSEIDFNEGVDVSLLLKIEQSDYWRTVHGHRAGYAVIVVDRLSRYFYLYFASDRVFLENYDEYVTGDNPEYMINTADGQFHTWTLSVSNGVARVLLDGQPLQSLNAGEATGVYPPNYVFFGDVTTAPGSITQLKWVRVSFSR